MKIVFLNSTYGEVFRGGETYTGELVSGLSKLNHQAKIFRGFVEFVKSGEKPDIVVPVNGRLQVILTKLWCLLISKKMVVSGQSGLGFIDRLNLMCFPDVFVCLSKRQQEWAKSRNIFVKTVVIPNGVDHDKFKPEKSDLKIKLPKPVVLWVGALDQMKRPELVIQAVAKTKASLFLVGKGPREQELLELGNKLLPGRFAIMSFTYDQMPQVYRAADLFVFSTVPWESFGIAILEAMATNLPVVVSNDSIRKEIVGDAGFTVDVTNSGLFSQKIDEALNKNWGNIPRERAKMFSWDKIAKKYEELFNAL